MSATPNAVYYAPKDYAHLARRIGAFVVDLVVLLLLIAALNSGVAQALVPKEVRNRPLTPETQRQINSYIKPVQVPLVLVTFVLLPMAYHMGLRRLRGGTLGYRLTGIRVVDRAGETPTWRVLLRRFLLAVPAVLPLGAGYWHCFGDPKRQAVHDQWSGTWVVRKKAVPVGPAVTAYQTKLFGTLLLTYIEVEPYAEPSPEDVPFPAFAGAGEPDVPECPVEKCCPPPREPIKG